VVRVVPQPDADRMVRSPGFQAACGTSTVNCRRCTLTDTVGAGRSTLPVLAAVIVACRPWTVTKYAAGEVTSAPYGHSWEMSEPPSAIVKPTREGSERLLSVTRNAVELGSGLVRNSTRSAALAAYLRAVG
jgi:hypothetical protein